MAYTVQIVATPETSASSLFGLYDTLVAAGQDWEHLVSGEESKPVFDVTLVGPDTAGFRCGSGVWIAADQTFDKAGDAAIVVVPGLTLSPHERPDPKQHPCLSWLAERDLARTRIVSACTGAVYLAEIGLLDGIEATTHWAWEGLFHRSYPAIRLRTDRGLCFADASRGPVTSGGTTGWQELATFLIAHYGGTQMAARAAKVWLMANRGELQAPFTSLITMTPHADMVITQAQEWIADHYMINNPVGEMAGRSGLPPTTFARRFRKAINKSPQDYVLALRIEEARQLLETSELSVADVGEAVGYFDTPSFRKLFKRKTGLTPAEHRKMFGKARFSKYL
ncbi:helix-turn-helix domain-containing protein [Marivita sp. XM-24bin2]|uniref:GlxA family transcriptional regulator n=1 Tax=unclassified Marivita TaxID=2632480 RepID=UPI000D7A0892|nr:helix-turn-helix domain-containing protein [Marivita sp. XM-24bin2]MCR9108608.1 helix-turn-helix domain-containing protein [Paracoccaceae bacterium]PWL36096.1 MAG: transcriptional regulator [Marivita sp. XM-24bin2]